MHPILQVPICGNSSAAKEEVSCIIRAMGMIPIDRGTIDRAGDLEDLTFTRFPEWVAPLIFSAIVIAFFWIILVFR